MSPFIGMESMHRTSSFFKDIPSDKKVIFKQQKISLIKRGEGGGQLFLGFNRRITGGWMFLRSKSSHRSPSQVLRAPYFLNNNLAVQKTFGDAVNSTNIALATHRIEMCFWLSAAIDKRLLNSHH